MPVILVDAILFDNDGTLIDSTPGVVEAWRVFGMEYNFDGKAAAHDTHGRRLMDSLFEYCNLSGDKLRSEVDRFEQLVIDVGPVILPGAHNLLNSINAGRTPETPGWILVTSATSTYAPAALRKANVPLPLSMVTSDDVTKGKPFPDPYLTGAAKLGLDPKNCLVIEDAPSGIQSGRDAGAKTLGVCTTHSSEALSKFKPDYVVKDLTRVSARWVGKQVEVTILADDSL